MHSNEDLLDNTLDGFYQCVADKKLVLFGAGNEMKRALPLFLAQRDLRPAYCVDNDFRRWYGRFLGIPIFEPAELEREDRERLVVLITSLYPFRIKEQIKRLGVVHYYASHLFVEPMLGRRNFITNL